MIIGIIVMGLILVCALVAIIVLKSDSEFWKGMYRDIYKWLDDVHKTNAKMIETCKEDIDFAHRVIDTKERLLNELKRVEQERHELAVKLLTLENLDKED